VPTKVTHLQPHSNPSEQGITRFMLATCIVGRPDGLVHSVFPHNPGRGLHATEHTHTRKYRAQSDALQGVAKRTVPPTMLFSPRPNNTSVHVLGVGLSRSRSTSANAAQHERG